MQKQQKRFILALLVIGIMVPTIVHQQAPYLPIVSMDTLEPLFLNSKNFAILLGEENLEVSIAFRTFLENAGESVSIISTVEEAKTKSYVAIIAHGNNEGLQLKSGFVSWTDIADDLRGSAIQTILLAVCDGAVLSSLLPNKSVVGFNGKVDAIVAGLWLSSVFLSGQGESDVNIKQRILERLTDIENGAIPHFLAFATYSSRYWDNGFCGIPGLFGGCSFWVITDRHADIVLYGTITSASFTLINSLLIAASLQLGSATSHQFLAALLTAVRIDLLLVLAQITLGYILRSDHRVVIGIEGGVIGIVPYFFPFVDYGFSRAPMVLPKLYSAIASLGIAGLIGVAITEVVVGAVFTAAIQAQNTNGREIVLIN